MLWLIIATGLVASLFAYLKLIKPLQYWKTKGVSYVKPWPILGNMSSMFLRTQAFGHYLQEVYNRFSNQRYFGFYQFSLPTLIVRDPNLIKQICIKDFDFFADHQEFLPKSADPFWDKNLFSMTGKDWHDMRSILSPAFTSSKMKTMFGLMCECAQEFLDHFQNPGITTVEMKDIFLRFTNNVIASTAFGIKVDSIKDKDNEFFRLGKNAFNFDGLRSLKFFGQAISPALMKFLNVRFFDEYTKKFFKQIVRDTIKHREETGLVRPDMIHLLCEAQKSRLKNDDVGVIDSGFAVTQESNLGGNRKQNKMTITEEDIAAQAVVFFFGGFDTVSVLMCHMAYELAVNPDEQDNLIEEVDRTLEKCNGQISYEALIGMKYMDMVASETLRMWSPAVFANRTTLKPYTIDPQQPGEQPLVIDRGTAIWFPIYALHRDPQYFPNPDKFDPERFNDENGPKILPCTYMPFGAGPRTCIASRFALLEAKVVIFYLLTKFNLVPVKKTQIPFALSKKNINIINDVGYWLGLKRRK